MVPRVGNPDIPVIAQRNAVGFIEAGDDRPNLPAQVQSADGVVLGVGDVDDSIRIARQRRREIKVRTVKARGLGRARDGRYGAVWRHQAQGMIRIICDYQAAALWNRHDTARTEKPGIHAFSIDAADAAGESREGRKDPVSGTNLTMR